MQSNNCSYCGRRFGSLVTWKKRNLFLSRVREHPWPRSAGGVKTIPACQLCNMIKGSLCFESFNQIQQYCLDTLLNDGSITKERVQVLLKPLEPLHDAHVLVYKRVIPGQERCNRGSCQTHPLLGNSRKYLWGPHDFA